MARWHRAPLAYVATIVTAGVILSQVLTNPPTPSRAPASPVRVAQPDIEIPVVPSVFSPVPTTRRATPTPRPSAQPPTLTGQPFAPTDPPAVQRTPIVTPSPLIELDLWAPPGLLHSEGGPSSSWCDSPLLAVECRQ